MVETNPPLFIESVPFRVEIEAPKLMPLLSWTVTVVANDKVLVADRVTVFVPPDILILPVPEIVRIKAPAARSTLPPVPVRFRSNPLRFIPLLVTVLFN